MLDQALEHFPGQVQAVEIGVAYFQLCHQTQRLGVVIKTLEGLHACVELIFTRMTKWRMTKIMGQRQRFGEVFIKTERSRHAAGDLGDFQRMCESGAVMIALVGHENLCFLLQAAKGGRVNDAVAIPLKRRTGGGWRLFKIATTAVFEARRKHGSLFHRPISPYLVCMSTVTAPDVTLSASAAKRINAILAKQDGAEYLRVSVEGGGCSGFSYKFDFADAANPDDLVVERDGARVLIDEMSLEFLGGSEIDFSTELIGAAFKINNPNATAACGCGTSFSV